MISAIWRILAAEKKSYVFAPLIDEEIFWLLYMKQ